ncbi:MAG: alpha/beta hydrolase [Thiobacillaceae bacterium]|jgi:putative phosphoribosyl transferase
METLSYDRVENIPVNGVSIEGRLQLPEDARGLVLFAHGSGSSRHSPRNNYVAGVLRDRRLGTLLMDLLSVEEDTDYARRFDIELLTERLVAATTWIRSQDATRALPVGYFGASTGAAAALDAAFRQGKAIRAVVSRGGRPDLASLNALRGVQAPTLFIVGGWDTEVLELNQLAYAELNCVRDFAIVPNATHLFEEPGTLEAAAALAAAWFARHLPGQE